MPHSKQEHAPFFGKVGSKLIGAGKGAINSLNNDSVNAGVTALFPEVGLGLAVARKVGLLERFKN